MEYKYKKADGKMAGTGGWRAEHDSRSCTCHTGLYKGNKVIALFVAKGHFEDISQEIKETAEEVTRKLNSHAALVSALEMIAAGHGCPSALAQDALSKLAKGE